MEILWKHNWYWLFRTQIAPLSRAGINDLNFRSKGIKESRNIIYFVYDLAFVNKEGRILSLNLTQKAVCNEVKGRVNSILRIIGILDIENSHKKPGQILYTIYWNWKLQEFPLRH